MTGNEATEEIWLRQRYKYDRHVHCGAGTESEGVDIGGVIGREDVFRKFDVWVGKGIASVAVASVTVEKSGQGLDDWGTGTFGFFRFSRSGRQL